MTPRAGDRTMSLSDELLPLLAARAATDPDAARLLEMFTRAAEISSEHPPERISDVKIPKL
jgi:Cdc6-like AAA superfamily ATPase